MSASSSGSTPAERRAEAFEAGEVEAGPGSRTFRWSQGMKSLCLALLRLRLSNETSTRPLLLSGGKGSAASTLDSLIYKADSLGWPGDVLSLSREDSPQKRLLRWFERQNSQLNDPARPVRVFARVSITALAAAGIQVFLDGRRLEGTELHGIARELAAELGDEEKSGIARSGSLPATGEGLVGRESELAELHQVLADQSCRVLQIVASGGAGKTALAARLVDDLTRRGGPFTRIFVWSFYRQGFQAESMQPMWQFRDAVARALGTSLPEATSSREKVETLLAALRTEPTLFVLDGIEAMLHPSGPEAGRLRDDILPGLLESVAGGAGGPDTFCLLTTRLPVADLKNAPFTATHTLHLNPLRREPTRALLRSLGVSGQPRDLDAAAAFAEGRPLLVRLLASQFLAEPRDPHHGLRELLAELQDAARWADGWSDDSAMARMLRSYARWFAGRPELVLLQLSALFDRLPDDAAMHMLLASPGRVGGLLDDWRGLPISRWLEAADNLRARGLAGAGDGLVLELHPVIHGFFHAALRADRPEAWRAGHLALYEYFRALPDKELPDTFEEIEPLLRACYHGCQAKEYRRAFEEVGVPRISRGIDAYLFTQLGAVQETRALMGCFLSGPDLFPSDSDLPPVARGMILIMIAHCERLQDRLEPAIRAIQRALRWVHRGDDPLMTAMACVNAIRLYHTAGRLRRGLWTCLRLNLLAKRYPALFSKEPISPMEEDGANYCTGIVINLLLACGRSADGEKVLAPILTRLTRRDPGLILLPGLPAPFHATWLIETGRMSALTQAIELGQAEYGVRQFEFNNGTALIKGRAWTQAAIDAQSVPDAPLVAEARSALDDAVNQARNFGRWVLVAEALLHRSRWHSHYGREEDYERDRNQARELSRTYGFRLIEADLALLETDHRIRARQTTAAKISLRHAHKIVRQCHYQLRKPEIARLRGVLKGQRSR